MAATTHAQNFESVYRRSYQTIFRFVKRLCRNHEEAEDVTQETFARAYAAIQSFKHDRPIENWLIRIAHNTFLDFKRKERRRLRPLNETALADDRGLETVVDDRPTPDQMLARHAIDPAIREAFWALDEESRQLVRMAHIDQIPYPEIAGRLGLKLPTVRSRLHRACRRIQREAAAIELRDLQSPRLLAA